MLIAYSVPGISVLHNFLSEQPLKVGAIFIPILLMGKIRHQIY